MKMRPILFTTLLSFFSCFVLSDVVAMKRRRAATTTRTTRKRKASPQEDKTPVPSKKAKVAEQEVADENNTVVSNDNNKPDVEMVDLVTEEPVKQPEVFESEKKEPSYLEKVDELELNVSAYSDADTKLFNALVLALEKENWNAVNKIITMFDSRDLFGSGESTTYQSDQILHSLISFKRYSALENALRINKKNPFTTKVSYEFRMKLLLDSIENGDELAVISILRSGIDSEISKKSEVGFEILRKVAVDKLNISLLIKLLDYKVPGRIYGKKDLFKANVIDNDGNSLAIFLIKKIIEMNKELTHKELSLCSEIINTLKEYGLNLNKPNKNGETIYNLLEEKQHPLFKYFYLMSQQQTRNILERLR